MCFKDGTICYLRANVEFHSVSAEVFKNNYQGKDIKLWSLWDQGARLTVDRTWYTVTYYPCVELSGFLMLPTCNYSTVDGFGDCKG